MHTLFATEIVLGAPLHMTWLATYKEWSRHFESAPGRGFSKDTPFGSQARPSVLGLAVARRRRFETFAETDLSLTIQTGEGVGEQVQRNSSPTGTMRIFSRLIASG